MDTETYTKTVCKIGQGAECCRYLLMGPSGWECGKGDPRAVDTIDRKVAEGSFISLGDNCEGMILSDETPQPLPRQKTLGEIARNN